MCLCEGSECVCVKDVCVFMKDVLVCVCVKDVCEGCVCEREKDVFA